MTEAAARQNLGACVGTTDPELRRQSDNLIVRIVNVLWGHPGAIGFYRLLTEMECFESRWTVRESLYWLVRARVVEETLTVRYRIADGFRRWTR